MRTTLSSIHMAEGLGFENWSPTMSARDVAFLRTVGGLEIDGLGI